VAAGAVVSPKGDATEPCSRGEEGFVPVAPGVSGKLQTFWWHAGWKRVCGEGRGRSGITSVWLCRLRIPYSASRMLRV